MGDIIHCRCGRAMECGRTDVLETVLCPACQTELALDLESNGERKRGYLKVIAGPERSGEELLIPVDLALPVGSAVDNWLYLPGGAVAERHCLLQLEPEGRLAVSQWNENADGSQKVLARLQPNQVMRVGKYVLRFSVGEVQAPRVASAGGVTSANPALAQPVPVMQRVGGRGILAELTRSRFRVARWALYATAAILAAHHAMLVARQDKPIYAAIGVLVLILWGMVLATRRVGMGQRMWNLTAIAALVCAAGLEMWLHQPLTTAGLLVLPAGLLLTMERPPGSATTIVTLVLMVVSLALLLIGLGRIPGAIGA